MAFGAKVSLHVDTSNKASFATEIQKYVEQATKTPIQIKNIRIKIDPKALTKDINDRIRAGGGITVDVKSINAKPAIEKLRQDISKMLSGLTVGGVSAFMDGKWDEYKGSDGFKKDKKSAEDAAKATSEFNAQMKLLSSTARNVSNVAPALGDADDNEAFNNSIKESVEWLKKYYSLKNSKSPMAADEYAEFLKQGEAIHANVLKYKEQLKLEENSLQIQTKIEALKGRVQKFISANPKAYKANQYELDGILSSLDAIEANSPEAKTHLESIRLAFLSINNASREAGIMGETFFGKLKKGWEKFSNWATVSKTFMFGVRTIKTMFNSVKELDDAMVELRKVTNLTEKDYERFIEKSTAISKEVGASAADVVMASANFAKIGYSAEESSFLAEAALVYKNVGDGIEDVEEATSSIISTIKAFEHTGLAAKDAMSIVDKFNEVGNRFAIDSEGIGIALQKSASALAAANNGLDQSIALITAANSVIQNPEVVGTAIKTISMYLRAAKTEAEEAGEATDGMANSVSELRSDILKLTGNKVDIMLDDKTFKSPYDILKEISEVWDNIEDIDQANIVELLGGKRNANVITSLLNNFEIAEDALAASQGSAGSALKENDEFLKGISGKLQLIKAEFDEISRTVINSGIVKFLLDVTLLLSKGLNFITKIPGMIPAVVTGIVAIKAAMQTRTLNSTFSSLSGLASGSGEIVKNEALAASISKLNKAQQKLLRTTLLNNAADDAEAKNRVEEILQTYNLTEAKKKLNAEEKKASGLKAGFFASMGVGGWITAGISAIAFVSDIVSSIRAEAKRQVEEAANASREIAEAHTEERNQLSTLINRYEEIAQSDYFDTQTREEIKQIQEDIVSLVGSEAEGLDLINGNLDDNIRKLREYYGIKSGETISDYEKAYKDAQNETKSNTVHEGNWKHNLTDEGKYNVITFDFWGDNKSRDKGLEIIDKAWKEKGLGIANAQYVGGLLPGDTYSRLVLDEKLNDTERAEAIRVGIEALEKAEGYDYNDSKLWKRLVEIYNSMTGEEGFLTKQKNAANSLVDTLLVSKVGEGKDVTSEDEYKAYTEEVIKAISENETVKDAIANGDLKKEDIKAAVNEYFGNFRKYSEYTKTNTQNQVEDQPIPFSTEDLAKVSDNIKVLGSASKELADDGYITTKTLEEIQKATNLSGDAWNEYKNKLLNAKADSEEFNQTMSDLTYKILDNAFAGKDLTDVTEAEIEAILRENGVVNASAVAHEYRNRKLAETKVAALQAKVGEEDFQDSLEKVADECGLTTNAIVDMMLKMIMLNNTNLSFYGQIEQIRKLREAMKMEGDVDGSSLGIVEKQGTVGKGYSYNGKWYNSWNEAYRDALNNDTSKYFQKPITPEYSGSDKSQKDIEKERLKNTRDYAEKVSDINKDLAEKIEDINEDLAEKEAEFAENMQEAWEEERYESLKEDLDKRRDLLDKYEKDLDTYDFGLDLIDDKDFDTQESLLNRKLQTTMEYSAKLKKEFDRLASLTPQTGKEAQEVADAIGEIGEKLRQNATTIRETTTALYEAKLGQITSLADGQISALEHEINRIDRLIDIVRNTDDDYGKYTEDLLFADVMFGSLTTTNNKELKERKKKDNELIKQQEETQATINEIVTKSLNQQIEDNKAAREKERQNLIDDMEKTRQDAMEKLEEAKQEAAEKIADATEDFQEKMSDISNSAIDTTNTVSDAFTSSFSKIQETIDSIDTTNYKEKIKEIESLTKNLQEVLGSATSSASADISKLQANSKSAFDYAVSATFRQQGEYWDSDGHDGMDFAAVKGTPIIPIKAGKIIAKSVSDSGVYGYYVKIDHGDGLVSLYAHMSRYGEGIEVGKQVDTDSIIGYVGATGNVTGDHLHLETIKNGVKENPEGYLPGHADGTESSDAGLAFVGESGYELAITPDGVVHIVGRDGVELADLPAGTRILTHEESEEILNNPTKLESVNKRHSQTVSGRHQYILSDIIKQNESAMESDNANYLSMVSDVMSQYQSGELTDEEYDEALLGLKNTLIDMQGTTANNIAKTIQDAFVAWMKDVDSGVIDYDSEVAQMYFDEYTKYFDLAKEADEAAYETKHSEIERIHDEVMQQVSDLQHELDLATKADPLFDPTSYYRQMQELYHNEAERLRSIDPEKYKDEIQQLQNQWWDAEDAIKDYTSRVFSEIERIIGRQTEALQERADAYDILINKNQALVDSESKFYETQKTIREAQREINNELNASKKLSTWMDEYTRQFLFNEKDYDVLSDKLKTLQKDTQEIYSWYQNQINGLTEDNWYLEAAITKEYERRLASKEREYEIARAELNLAKKQSELNNILAEKNVTMVVGGQLQQVADYQKLMEATEEVANLESELAEIRLTNEQQYALDTKRAHIDGLNNEKAAIENRIKMINDQTEEMRRAIEDFIEPLGDLARLFETITGFNIPGLDEELGALKHRLNSGSEYSFSLNPGNKVVKVNPDGNAPKGLNEGDVVLTAGGAYRINVVNPDGSYESGRIDEIDYSKKSGYASGTPHALAGWHKVNELGYETYMTQNGILHDFSGGETVFSHKQTKNLFNLSKLNILDSLTGTHLSPGIMPAYKEAQTGTSQSFGDIIINNPRDYDDFLWQLNKHIGNKIK